MKLSVWAIFMVVSAVAIIGFVVAGQIAQSKTESREAAPVPPVNPQPYYSREPDGRMFYRGTDGVKAYPDGTLAQPVSAGLILRESFNTTGKIESIVEDGADRYLLTRDNDGTLRVVLARKGQPNRTLVVIRQAWRAEVLQ